MYFLLKTTKIHIFYSSFVRNGMRSFKLRISSRCSSSMATFPIVCLNYEPDELIVHRNLHRTPSKQYGTLYESGVTLLLLLCLLIMLLSSVSCHPAHDNKVIAFYADL